MKKCSKCKRELPLDTDHFHKDKHMKNGFTSRCKECRGKGFTSQLQVKEGFKICFTCKKELPMSKDYYHKDPEMLDGLHSRCKECRGYSFTNKLGVEVGYKRCSTCGEDKKRNLNNFSKYGNSEDGFNYRCKACNIKYNKKYYDKNQELLLAYKREYYSNNQPKFSKRNRISNQIRKAKKNQVAFTLTRTQWSSIKLSFNNSCAYCGISEEQHFIDINERLHQEHFVPLSIGGEYTINNILPSCKSCNSSKGTKSFFEWYPSFKYYNKEREQFILEYLNYKTKNIQQLALF